MTRTVIGLLLAWLLVSGAPAAQTSVLPNASGSLKFAVIGDNGTGDRSQYDVGGLMAERHRAFGFDMVLMLGDNIYGGHSPADYVKKFEQPYAPLLRAGVKFFATLGNHDAPDARNYAPFNMDGQRYYTFARNDVRFVVLDTNFVDPAQRTWADDTLRSARERWKIVYFHHALYSSAGRHGSAVDIRVLLEPILVRHGVNAVFSGHDHTYERLKPQRGITYFVVGSSGQLRRGDLEDTGLTAAGYDQDRAFLIAEIDGDTMYFEAISRTGQRVDSGVIPRQARPVTTN
jgi:3',5'-cyclic AMP phosphodiesterase CpdA